MVLKPDQERLKALLKETITLLCKNGLHYSSEFCIEALIGITLDKDDVMLVSINETIQSEAEKLSIPSCSEPELKSVRRADHHHSSHSTPNRDASNPPTPKESDARYGDEYTDSPANRSAQGSSSFFRGQSERKRGYSDTGDTGVSPSKRPSYGVTNSRHQSSDVVVIKEESESDDEACVISQTETAPMPPDLSGINFEHAQLVPVGGSMPGCSSWNVAPPTGLPNLDMSGAMPPGGGPGFMMPPPREPPRVQGEDTELVPGSAVYIPTTVYQSLNQEYFPKGSKLVRRLVHTIFPDDYELANSSCLGRRGDSCHKGLDQRKVEAIKAFTTGRFPELTDRAFIKVVNNMYFVLSRYPEMLSTEVIQSINVCCCQARQKLRTRFGVRASQDELEQQGNTDGCAQGVNRSESSEEQHQSQPSFEPIDLDMSPSNGSQEPVDKEGECGASLRSPALEGIIGNIQETVAPPHIQLEQRYVDKDIEDSVAMSLLDLK